MSVPDKVSEAAKKHFAEHFGEEEHVVARTASDRHPADGRAIHLFLAVRSGVANDNAVELILDDDAHPVQLERRRHALFVPDVEPVPLEVTEAVTVKVNPAVNNLRLGECDTVKEKITVTIPASAAVAPADIYFLADNTASMGAVIASVQAGANAIFAGLGPLTGLQFGVGEYRDFDNPAINHSLFRTFSPSPLARPRSPRPLAPGRPPVAGTSPRPSSTRLTKWPGHPRSAGGPASSTSSCGSVMLQVTTPSARRPAGCLTTSPKRR